MAGRCLGCGQTFQPRDPRQAYCRKGCGRTDANRARAATRSRHDVRFTAVDGEGVTRSGSGHDYVMLSVGSDTLHADGARLDTRSIFEYLYAHHDSTAFVGYYLGYDFTQWIRNLPENVARELVTGEGIASRRRTSSGKNPVPFPVRWDGWEFDLLADRRFKLRPAGSKKPWQYICDAGPFFQTSFMKAIDPRASAEPIVTADELTIIAEGKQRRADAQFGPEMARYNVTENAVMSRLMSGLNTGLVKMGIRLDRDQWFGPGQAAGEWLSGRIPDTDTLREIVPAEVLEAARRSFYAGWFEIYAHGKVGTLHEHDKNSAYPWAISGLPCLLHGRWEATPPKEGELGLILAEVRGNSPIIGAMLHREADGTLHRPQVTRGWYWRHELDAALRAGCVSTYRTDGGFTYHRCSCLPPLAEIAQLYDVRLAVGKNTVQGKACKLVYNSCYGKLAQSVGNPRWSNPIYASMITSLTRTSILDAITLTTHDNIAMIATDGIYTFDPLPLHRSPTTLGAWDGPTKHGVTLMMPGVYWDDDTRARLADGGTPKMASRGVNAASLARGIDNLDWQWATWRMGQEWPTVTVPLDFSMITARQALARGKWELAGQLIPNDTKTISGNPVSKRNPDSVWVDSSGIVRTMCYPKGQTLDSHPYDRSLGTPPDPALMEGPFSVLFNALMH